MDGGDEQPFNPELEEMGWSPGNFDLELFE
jgi:hypothetical protein